MTTVTPLNFKCTSRSFLRWIKALESGKYNQGEGVLYGTKNTEDGEYGFCCLGVFEKVQGTPVETMPNITYPSHLKKPHRVKVINRKTGQCSLVFPEDIGLRGTKTNSFITPSVANDSVGMNFQQIAAALREYLD